MGGHCVFVEICRTVFASYPQEDREMLHRLEIWSFAVLALAVAGCGQSNVANQSPTPPANQPAERDAIPAVASVDPVTVAATDTPEKAAHEFLEALRQGNDVKATQMLSKLAREKTAALNRNLTPSASDTAQFTVGEAEYVTDDGARVACTWSDKDERGTTIEDSHIWVLRREAEGWRIAGVAVEIFKGEPPLLLNFENPDDMIKKERWARQEILKRAAQEAQSQAAADFHSDEAQVRR
jgi:hypothetical protein